MPWLVVQREYRHVQQNDFTGLSSIGNGVAIMALMRGGEPMARGVFDCFPEAQFIHYVDGDGLDGIVADHIIIVDSVINDGATIRRFLATLPGSSKSPRPQIYVLTGVMQELAAKILPKEFPWIRFLALRISTNKYSGKGSTDTGNRLFGTM